MDTTTRLPKMVVFDLDYTLWDLWIDTHIAAGALRRHKNTLNKIFDKNGTAISFYKDVPGILQRLRDSDVTIAACSRTHAPDMARAALSLLLMPAKDGSKGTPAIEFFDQKEIYPGSKIRHFKRLHEKTGIPYSEMVFYDDESRNREVEQLGVTFVLVPDGVDNKIFEKGLETWRKRHPDSTQ